MKFQRTHTRTALISAALACTSAFAQFGPGPNPQPYPAADIVFVLDGSGSTSSSTAQFDGYLDAVASTIGTLIPINKSHRVAVVVFDSAADLTVEIPFTFTTSTSLVTDIGNIVAPGGGTDVESGLQRAYDLFDATPINADIRQVILLTDADSGQFNDSDLVAADLRADLDVIVSVGLTTASTTSFSCDDRDSTFCASDLSSLYSDLIEALEVSNAPVNAPYYGTLAGTYLPGVAECIPDADLSSTVLADHYTPFLTEALCPTQYYYYADNDSNGIPDLCDVAITFPDCNSNGTPDYCEPTYSDCNSNGIADFCEALSDCDSDGIPDICEDDCDSDGTPDDCESDCDSDGIPDDCEPDCDGDGIPDDCDPDVDGDDILDIYDSIIGPCDGGEPIDPEPIGG